MARILIVDDESSIRKVLSAQLRMLGHDVLAACDGTEAVELLAVHPVQLVVSDLRMPGMDGMDLLSWVTSNLPGVPVILVTAHGTVDSAVEALKRGAFDYLTKPFDHVDLSATVTKALATARRGPMMAVVEANIDHPALRPVRDLLARVAASPAAVLITGEPGTGLDLVARTLHGLSEQRNGAFIATSCGAVPEGLIEAELFGIDASDGSRKPGRLELANGGTLFLDEVQALPLDVQDRLLRAIQQGGFHPVGSARRVSVSVRVISGTDHDLSQLCRAGAFLDDLLYRLRVIPVDLAPLRDRTDDLPDLTAWLLERHNARLGTAVVGISDEAMNALKRHTWPGNLRELESLIERVVLLADGPVVGIAAFDGLLDDGQAPVLMEDDAEDLGLKEYLRLHTARLERTRIRHALGDESGNVTRAAKRLGISRRSLQTKMKEYGLRER